MKSGTNINNIKEVSGNIEQIINNVLNSQIEVIDYRKKEEFINIIKESEILNNKVDFICCTNDSSKFNNIVKHINALNIPQNFKVGVIGIENAPSMASGYNLGMKSSCAKYKVYLHQDVLIMNKNFIEDIVSIFNKYDKLGILGVIGAKTLEDTAVWWKSGLKYGKVYDNQTGIIALIEFDEVEAEYEAVECIDGLIMITQYDIAWREDIFDGWHFYDASECREFILNGYEVGIPKQEWVWCIHDSGPTPLDSEYERYRLVFLSEYMKNVKVDVNKKIRFVTLFPGAQNIHLIKDVGMIPFILHKYFGYDSSLACYGDDEYPFLENQVSGLKLDIVQKNTGNEDMDGNIYLLRNALNIDILQVYHWLPRTLNWVNIYKRMNPNGKVYIKLDVNSVVRDIDFNMYYSQLQKENFMNCTLISGETKDLCEYLNRAWPINVQYIPSGFYDYENKVHVSYEEKENIICTVGRIGSYQKATEILMMAFKEASSYISDWKLKIIGSIEKDFEAYIDNFFKISPELKDRIIFTGEINDRVKLKEEYNKAKIFCLTSRWESFGLAFVEAESSGCYIISSNVDSAKDITDNKKYGDIFEVNNIGQLSQSFIKHCNDENELKIVCEEVQHYAYENFYWVKICKKIKDYLSNI